MTILAYIHVRVKCIYIIILCKSSNQVLCFKFCDLIAKTLNGFQGEILNPTVSSQIVLDLPRATFLSVTSLCVCNETKLGYINEMTR